ncbi:CDP-diacylglycerol--serine O-phosphatidyltransferase [Novipirellula artificiosorum]|uniref:CDP-diacylglycerol--serine O-phosphatidyltransferase n=1 Tax=Novipirellula artificiosorum TaxID=2528016 RepID=A0A5C6DV14_9BACT|nr:CDP-diacylglycerol--serine O-phosphatidyltransferase [Novipirellula artificiosorum]TWU40530.1 CDP-alcohol phosphatidyltransferase [Novipirellula artificiosorum]
MSEMKRSLFAAPASDQEAEVSETAAAQKPGRGSRLRKGKGRKRLRRRISLAFLPTLLTLGNAVCGLAAISVAVSVNLPWPDEMKLFAAGVLIFAGMLFDALDGSAARMTGQESRFGAELDSLCDVITFGTAPAVIVWRLSDVFPQKLSWAIGVLFTLCVLIRLARFNVETTEEDPHEGFDGLPSPAAAGTIAAFAIAMPDLASIATDSVYPDFVHTLAQAALDASHYFIPCLAVVLAYLMTSRFQFPHVFQQLVSGRWTTHQFGQALFAIVAGFLLHWIALPIGFCLYAFAPPIRSVTRRGRPGSEDSVVDEDVDEDGEP